MKGILYGVGVGCGDPQDMTLKAVNIIKNSRYIAVPVSSGDKDMVAFNIAKANVSMEDKEILYLDMPMTRDIAKLDACHDKAAEEIIEILKTGNDVAFLTLGDPTVYSTYMYVHKRVVAKGSDCVIIPGITSFTATAAKLGVSLGEREEAIVIIPGSYDGLEEALDIKGTKVLMKSGRKMDKVKEILREKNLYDNAMMVERCSMENQVIHKTLDTADENSSYFSVIVVREKKV